MRIFILLLIALLTLYCEGPVGPEGPPGQHGYNILVHREAVACRNWKAGKDRLGHFDSTHYVIPEITERILNKGFIIAYLDFGNPCHLVGCSTANVYPERAEISTYGINAQYVPGKAIVKVYREEHEDFLTNTSYILPMLDGLFFTS